MPQKMERKKSDKSAGAQGQEVAIPAIAMTSSLCRWGASFPGGVRPTWPKPGPNVGASATIAE
ncbi:hypothetical protein CPAR01_01075 [Colletotrichum paranaense]|uniref:Uncharacterized protein n=2 Tax=Colletotrichum acutatum species complex TaxID=2707335 RepID=A0AAI9UBS8_9PEZI|nr:uncharacterized protein CPAR01_01075 [Colletotrichum paranaense]KAK1455419.1 hypothetical protein CMEL01_04179 [Colletotrichum melonis]KAK1547108.1 hypothetical protein CPAR01_01075 [Colletotrichum paranaense]